MTCRHLKALGVDAELANAWTFGPKGGRKERYELPLMRGRAVLPSDWYSFEQLAELPKWACPVWTGPRLSEVVAGIPATQLGLAFA